MDDGERVYKAVVAKKDKREINTLLFVTANDLVQVIYEGNTNGKVTLPLATLTGVPRKPC